VYPEGDFFPVIRQGGIRGNRDGNVVADSVDINDDLIGPFFEQRAPQAGDHTAFIISALE
jgi:hypothetical protein